MFGLPKYGNGVGFRRLLAFCEEQRIDLDRIGNASIVITGSNGKGSTTRFVYELLRPSVERVGSFISPHLLNVRERFEISGVQIDEAALDDYARRILAFNERLERRKDGMGAFELMFLVALLWFRDRDIQCAVWEAGVGGRYDPVRLLCSPLSALTSVDLEHTEILGATRQLIAFDKMDATRPGGQMFVSPAVDPHLYGDLEAFARITGKTLSFVSHEAAIGDVTREGDRMQYTMAVPGPHGRVRVTIPLLGMHQVHNSATAVCVASAYLSLHHPGWSLSPALEAVSRLQWPGRLEKIAGSPETWIDVGHTPEAIEQASRTLLAMDEPAAWLIVFGVSANKAVADIAAVIRHRFPAVVVTRAYKGGSDPTGLAAEHFDRSQVLGVAGTIEQAVTLSRSIATERGLKIAVLGGLFLAVEFAHAARGNDPQSLDFF